MSTEAIITSNSRIQALLDCPRKGYLGYCAPNGITSPVQGWERRALNIFLATGIYTHYIPEHILQGESLEQVIPAARRAYMDEVAKRGFECEVQDDSNYAAFEQAALVEAFGWAFSRVMLPQLEAEWEWRPEDAEREFITPLSDDVVLASRVDWLARRKLDGRQFVWNFKTSGYADSRWSEGFEVNSQILTETLAVKVNTGETVDGVCILGLKKGARVGIDQEGHEVRGERERVVRYIQRSPLVYGWKFDGNPPLEPPSYDYESSRKKGWHRFNVWEETNPPFAPGGMRPLEGWVSWLPIELVEAQFAHVPPIMRDDEALESRVRQIVGLERRVRNACHRISIGASSVDEEFPQNTDRCLYPTKCWAYEMCHVPGVMDDPEGSGIFQPRTANHPAELVQIEGAR